MKRQKNKFTLIELLVSISIFLTLMTIVVYITNQVHRTWKLTEANSRVYENSRLLIDVLENDLKCLRTSSLSDSYFGFYVGDHDSVDNTKDFMLCFVAQIEANDTNAESNLCEVTYKFHKDDNDLDNQYIVKRQVVSDTDSTNWNFHNQPDNWWDNSSSDEPYETVIAGVDDIQIRIYDTSGVQVPAGNGTEQPVRIEIDIDVFDEFLLDDSLVEERMKTQRNFNKIIYMSHLQE